MALEYAGASFCQVLCCMKWLPLRLRRGRTDAFGGCGFCIFGFGGFGPTAEVEGDSHAGGAQFICKSAIDHGPGYDHASYGQGSYALRRSAATPAILEQAALQDADHGFEDGLEGALRTYAAAGYVGRQGDHGARILDVLEMLT